MSYQKYNFENLEVYALAEKLVLKIYEISKNFPKEELFILTSQLRRACLSIVLNIVEGSSRKSRKDFAHFIDISIGSLFETKAILRLSLKLKYLKENELIELYKQIDLLFYKLLSFKKYLLKE
ncbi:hypothetical protein A3A46_01040 [Candidatus Roizmanbacteria bacterium RIFCSPLOWO2_01_FULL_37_13]|uniref:Four helix bundle protein n=1 Tax=Candidatus Roizmanbacteria bacterium RIFCSPHIGHO2_02_FULL_38_11 TaxID=1802039 RepID=A0A1F7GY91_9BACT|nr:MAG: hypothetical protein A3C25_05500 [Candidatus Roizmanbacteria bacterium RIFCSPHIGHO2_02_FULL_38_11]OGK35511.1 MAG: hypothetical protein A3F58_01025 [Candidatus Roizmanbacteria bacterium RIFCSPHIGHO2_12_FULL_37_9b]OGK41273.1 MAG: hypothetical protein A3A46_01040 [Candidatus Roizmanbacteria bacterium RIFCSPLOWO2_01_FULL_37_13]